MNKELIEKTDKALKYLNEYKEYLEQMGKRCYELGYEYKNLVPKEYDTII